MTSAENKARDGKRQRGWIQGKVRWEGAALLMGMLLGFATALMGAAPPPEGAVESPAKAGVESLEELKKRIIAKNIFKPGRVQRDTAAASETLQPLILGPQALQRPFTVLGFDRVGEEPRAHLRFENPTEDRPVKIGEGFETIKIVNIEPPYLRCTYADREVSIGRGESSNDALLRLNGFGSDYHLKGTELHEGRGRALFYFLQGRMYRWVEEGATLGTAKVYQIRQGEVIMRPEFGEDFTVKQQSMPRNSQGTK